MCPGNHYGVLHWGGGGVLGTGRGTSRVCSPVHPLCTLPQVVWEQLCPAGLPPAQPLANTLRCPCYGNLHNESSSSVWGCVHSAPFPMPTGVLQGGLTFGAGVAAVPRQQRGPGAGGHRAILLYVLAVHFPRWLPPAVPLLREGRGVGKGGELQESRANVCQVMSPRHSLAAPIAAHLESPGHLAQPPAACTAAKPGPPSPPRPRPPAPCPAVHGPASPGLGGLLGGKEGGAGGHPPGGGGGMKPDPLKPPSPPHCCGEGNVQVSGCRDPPFSSP